MRFLQDLIKEDWHIRILKILIIIIAAFVLYRILRLIMRRFDKKTGSLSEREHRSLTYNKLTLSIARYAIIVAAFLLSLQVVGVNVSSLMAGLGIVSVIVGLALQDWIKDIIRGIDLLSDSFFHVGDVVIYKGMRGEVLSLGIKSTRIRLFYNGAILSIANRNIVEMEVPGTFFRETVPMPYDLPVYKAEKIIQDIIRRVLKNEHVDNCRYLGIQTLDASSIGYFLEVHAHPSFQDQAHRDTLRSILLALEANHVAVPFNQLDVHSIDGEARARSFEESTGGKDFEDFIRKSGYASNDSIFRKETYRIRYDGTNAMEILDGVEQFGWRMGCSRRESLQMRLLTEEMMELVKSISNRSWMTIIYGGKDKKCVIEVVLDNLTDESQKEKLLRMAAASQDKPGKGILDRMCRVAARFLTDGNAAEGKIWSLKDYINSVMEDDSDDHSQAMEELERSIIANLADDVRVSFQDRTVTVRASRSF